MCVCRCIQRRYMQYSCKWVWSFYNCNITNTEIREATTSAVCVCLWYSKCVYMCDIHHHLQCCVWKAGFVVVVLCAMCLLSHVQTSAALTRLQSQDAERLWMRIHKFTGALLARQGQEFLSFFPSPLVPLSASSVISSLAFSLPFRGRPIHWQDDISAAFTL